MKQDLLIITQRNDYTWIASLPEMPLMWAEGYSESEAIANWLQAYNQPTLASAFAKVAIARAKHPLPAQPKQPLIERPLTVDFPYRGKLYRIATNEGRPKRQIVLPDGRVLVVCQWVGRVPSALADIRRSEDAIPDETITAKLDGVLASELPLLPGQTTRPMAILDFEGQRYAIDQASHALVEMPDGRLYQIESIYPEEPVRIATLTHVDPTDSSMPYQLEHFGKTPAIPVASDYPGMAREPRDLRIHFAIKGERFVLSHEAYEQSKVIVYVPDHGFYLIGIYLDSSPLQLGRLEPLPAHHYEGAAAALRFADAVDIKSYKPEGEVSA